MGKIATIPNLATNQHPTLLLQLWSALLRKAMRDDQSDRRNEGSPGRHLPTSGGSWPNFSRFEAADADSKIHPRGHRQYPCRTAFWKKIERKNEKRIDKASLDLTKSCKPFNIILLSGISWNNALVPGVSILERNEMCAYLKGLESVKIDMA
jgi:hypothetical protein